MTRGGMGGGYSVSTVLTIQFEYLGRFVGFEGNDISVVGVILGHMQNLDAAGVAQIQWAHRGQSQILVCVALK